MLRLCSFVLNVDVELNVYMEELLDIFAIDEKETLTVLYVFSTTGIIFIS